MSGAYLQLGYVTNDFDEALKRVRQSHGLGPFKEMRELTIATRAGKQVTAHFALAFKADTQFEIIAPLAGDKEFYVDILDADGFDMRFHHLGRYFPQEADYRAALADARTRWEVPVEVAAFGGYYAYFDARKDFGHYLEIYTFPAEEHFEGVPRY